MYVIIFLNLRSAPDISTDDSKCPSTSLDVALGLRVRGLHRRETLAQILLLNHSHAMSDFANSISARASSLFRLLFVVNWFSNCFQNAILVYLPFSM